LGPTYLKEVKHASLEQGGFSTAIYELGGMFSTLLMGWLSDKAGGRRGMISVICMVPVFLAFGGLLYAPPGMLWLDLTLFGIVGFFIYPPVMLLRSWASISLRKKAVGTAAGFIGLFWLSRPHGAGQGHRHACPSAMDGMRRLLWYSSFHAVGDSVAFLDLELETAGYRDRPWKRPALRPLPRRRGMSAPLSHTGNSIVNMRNIQLRQFFYYLQRRLRG